MRIVVLSVLAGVALAGCGADTDAAELAAAKCSGALHEELGLDEGEHVDTSDVRVTGDDERRVSGRWTGTAAGQGEFSCVVVPDASDELRGLRVTDLSVQPLG
jgi:hypothetical protein